MQAVTENKTSNLTYEIRESIKWRAFLRLVARILKVVGGGSAMMMMMMMMMRFNLLHQLDCDGRRSGPWLQLPGEGSSSRECNTWTPPIPPLAVCLARMCARQRRPSISLTCIPYSAHLRWTEPNRNVEAVMKAFFALQWVSNVSFFSTFFFFVVVFILFFFFI